jgi:glycerate dehydrogenase
MNGVILDCDSLGPDSLDLSPLHNLPISWTIYPDCLDQQVAERIVDADIVLTNKAVISALAIAQAPRLKLIAVMATGTNQVDLEAATERGIVVSNAIGYGTGSVVQHCWSLILALTTKLESYHQAAVGGRWQQSRFFCSMDFPVRELCGKVLGIIGAGELGLGVAKIAEAFGMQVIYAGLPGRAHNSAIERVAFDAFLARADIISIHCPLTADTRDLIGEAQFALMQSSTLVINSARGGIVNEAALKQALCNGDIAGAATDVLTVEPPVDGNLLLDPSIPNLIVTPHSAWVAQEARQRLIVQLADNIGGYLDGKPRNQVN